MPHTLGPWVCKFVSDDRGCGHVVYGRDADGADRFICDLGSLNSIANARLIAAAPDLLKAAAELLDNLTDAGEQGPENFADDCDREVIEHDGKLWYPDVWALKLAIDKAFSREEPQ